MKKVEAIIRKSKFSAVKKALHEVGVNFFSYWDVTGLGNEKEGHVFSKLRNVPFLNLHILVLNI